MTTQAGSEDPAVKRGDDAGILITFRESPGAVKALLVGLFVNKLGQFIQVFLVLFLTNRGFTAVQSGAALSAYGAGSVLGLAVGGPLTDSLGVRRATLLSMNGTAALLIAILYVHNYPALLGVVALVGAVGRIYRPANAAMLSALTPKHRQVMIFAMQRLALNLGTTAAPLIGVALISISYNLLFWVEAAAEVVYAAIAMRVLPRGRSQIGAQEPSQEPAQRQVKGGYLAVLADRRYMLFLLALFVNSTVYIQYVSVLPLAMRAAGLATAWFGAVVALNGVIVITCELLMTKLTQRLPARLVVIIGFALLGGGLAIYWLPFGVAIFVVGTLVWSLAEIVAGPTMFAYPAMTGPARLRGRYMGSAQAIFGLGTAIGPVIGVTVWNVVGRSVWLWCALACLVGIAAGWLGVKPTAGASEKEAGQTGAVTADEPA